jgi:hypothetical protein
MAVRSSRIQIGSHIAPIESGLPQLMEWLLQAQASPPFGVKSDPA